MHPTDANAIAALRARVAAALDAACSRRDSRGSWDGHADGHRRIPLGARSTREVVADAVAARARARELVRRAEEVRRESAAARRTALLTGAGERE